MRRTRTPSSGSSSKSGSPDPKESRYAKLSRSEGSDPAGLAATDTTLLARCLDAVISEGDAVIFGRTTDGGAICVTILEGTERHKEYASDQAELDKLVSDLAEVLGL